MALLSFSVIFISIARICSFNSSALLIPVAALLVQVVYDLMYQLPSNLDILEAIVSLMLRHEAKVLEKKIPDKLSRAFLMKLW
jgi:hypothetical protein